MKLKHISAAVAVAILLPFAASALTVDDIQAQIRNLLAQITQLQEQLKSLQTPPSTDPMPVIIDSQPYIRPCPQILRQLYQGISGSDVGNLQEYLGVPKTGYFGPMTANAVAQFQGTEGLSQVGMVGPQTRAAFARKCGGGGNGQLSASPTRGAPPLSVSFWYMLGNSSSETYSIDFGDGTSATPIIGCGGNPNSGMEACPRALTASHAYTANGTYTAVLMKKYVCSASPGMGCIALSSYEIGRVAIIVGGTTSGGAPSISGLDAPSSLNVGQTGTWTVRTSVNGPDTNLRYSVIWGDEPTFAQIQAYANAPTARSLQTSGTFTHAYSSAGTYKPTFTVSNTSGSAQTSASVVVGGSSTGSNFSASPTSGAAPLYVLFHATIAGDVSPSTYTVDFGDGTSGTMYDNGPFPLPCGEGSGAPLCGLPTSPRTKTNMFTQHTYTSVGTYTATLVKPAPAGTRMPDVLLGTVTITVGVNFSGGAVSNPFVPGTSCKAWYDGCNSCSRSVPGGTGGCTKIACQSYSAGYCTANF